jgi:hypothetical protein
MHMMLESICKAFMIFASVLENKYNIIVRENIKSGREVVFFKCWRITSIKVYAVGDRGY